MLKFVSKIVIITIIDLILNVSKYVTFYTHELSAELGEKVL